MGRAARRPGPRVRADRGGERPGPGARTTSFQEWSGRLAELAPAGRFDGEIAYWQEAERVPRLPGSGSAANTAGSEDTVSVRLDGRTTAALLQSAPGAYRARVNEVLLAALGRALADWTGQDRVAVALEGHGREEAVVEGADLSRTVGWFTTVFPFAWNVSGGEGWRSAVAGSSAACGRCRTRAWATGSCAICARTRRWAGRCRTSASTTWAGRTGSTPASTPACWRTPPPPRAAPGRVLTCWMSCVVCRTNG
ncbi:condensation domain-containing protein [Streptomyces sanglieri]|uniref:Condensation domain-containing protein n=1 Tax=Streptomyces sanglieri TaxID=193460 RepID=A0ABW2WXK8_9ACTN